MPTATTKKITLEIPVSVNKDLARLTQENTELKLALRAVVSGELALRNKKTRPPKSFLKTLKHAQDK